MPNRFVQRDGTTVEMLTRVPVNRGSLLKSLDSLLKTIETSENAVMIPTLLKDKVRVDACELLFVAKILKASILGHSDLVEFYMNHIGHTSSSLQPHTVSAAGTPTSLGPPPLNSQPQFLNNDPLLSPSMRGLPPVSPMASPLLTHAINNHLSQKEQQQQQMNLSSLSSGTNNSASSNMSSSMSSNSANSASTPTPASVQAGATRSSSGCTSNSWLTAQQSLTTSGATSLASSSESSSSMEQQSDTEQQQQQQQQMASTPTNGLSPADSLAQEALLATANKPVSVRQAQPPSLLQLTTTNNHLNSMSDMFQGANQLVLSSGGGGSGGASTTGTLEGLSISTNTANSVSGPVTANGAMPAVSVARPNELRSSRSAGCLFRTNSGASSPRTPNGLQTPAPPFPQAETLAGAGSQGVVSDAGSLVKLLLQVEQLKASIGHCTSLLDSVVELYKKSIDNIV